MRLAFVVAADENGGIGKSNRLMWSLPLDLQHFKQLTLSKPIIMGRKTFESIGRALPQRTNIVLTRCPGFQAAGCVVVQTLEQAWQAAAGAEEAFIIGGAAVFEQTLDRVERIYLTRVHARLDADTFLPHLDPSQWQEAAVEHHDADDRHEVPFTFMTLERVGMAASRRRDGS